MFPNILTFSSIKQTNKPTKVTSFFILIIPTVSSTFTKTNYKSQKESWTVIDQSARRLRRQAVRLAQSHDPLHNKYSSLKKKNIYICPTHFSLRSPRLQVETRFSPGLVTDKFQFEFVI